MAQIADSRAHINQRVAVSVKAAAASEQHPRLEPLVVRPRDACKLLACGRTHLYALIAANEIESFCDGRTRKITLASIRKYVERCCSSIRAPSTRNPDS